MPQTRSTGNFTRYTRDNVIAEIRTAEVRSAQSLKGLLERPRQLPNHPRDPGCRKKRPWCYRPSIECFTHGGLLRLSHRAHSRNNVISRYRGNRSSSTSAANTLAPARCACPLTLALRSRLTTARCTHPQALTLRWSIRQGAGAQNTADACVMYSVIGASAGITAKAGVVYLFKSPTGKLCNQRTDISLEGFVCPHGEAKKGSENADNEKHTRQSCFTRQISRAPRKWERLPQALHTTYCDSAFCITPSSAL